MHVEAGSHGQCTTLRHAPSRCRCLLSSDTSVLAHRKVHVQSLARNRPPEELAHEVVQLKERVYQMQEQNVSAGMLMPRGGGRRPGQGEIRRRSA